MKKTFTENVVLELQAIQKIGGHHKVPSKAYILTEDAEKMAEYAVSMKASECASLLIELS